MTGPDRDPDGDVRARIDAELRAALRETPGPEFIPRVRARLEQEEARPPAASVARWVLPLAAVLVAGVIGWRAMPPPPSGPVHPAPSSTAVAPSLPRAAVSAPPVAAVDPPRADRRPPLARVLEPRSTPPGARPEVLIDPEQAALFDRLHRRRLRLSEPARMAEAPTPEDGPRALDELRIDGLGIPPLHVAPLTEG